MLKYKGRPHWAKYFEIKDFGELYPKWNNFKKIQKEIDPKKTFWNNFSERVFKN
jgi:FAD/FMN-containing dehydrogenase